MTRNITLRYCPGKDAWKYREGNGYTYISRQMLFYADNSVVAGLLGNIFSCHITPDIIKTLRHAPQTTKVVLAVDDV